MRAPRTNGKKLTAERPPAKQLDGTESEWKYKGRSNSEHTERHPITAPADEAARKAEGFQRFYKAVVSPTHVRVTAGGRIVPNNRTSSSPAGGLPNAKWQRDRVSVDASAPAQPASVAQPGLPPFATAQPQLGPQFGHFNPMMNGFVPGMHAAIAPGGAPYALMPLPLGFNMADGYAVPSPAFNHFLAPKPAANESNSSSRSDKQSESGASEKLKPIRISPPEQFDHSRPF